MRLRAVALLCTWGASGAGAAIAQGRTWQPRVLPLSYRATQLWLKQRTLFRTRCASDAQAAGSADRGSGPACAVVVAGTFRASIAQTERALRRAVLVSGTGAWCVHSPGVGDGRIGDGRIGDGDIGRAAHGRRVRKVCQRRVGEARHGCCVGYRAHRGVGRNGRWRSVRLGTVESRAGAHRGVGQCGRSGCIRPSATRAVGPGRYQPVQPAPSRVRWAVTVGGDKSIAAAIASHHATEISRAYVPRQARLFVVGRADVPVPLQAAPKSQYHG